MVRKISVDNFEYLIDGEVVGLISKRKDSFDVSFQHRKNLGDFLASIFYPFIKRELEKNE